MPARKADSRRLNLCGNGLVGLDYGWCKALTGSLKHRSLTSSTRTQTMWHKTLGGSALAFALFLLGAPAGAAPQ